jgi:hypothetical protein
MRASALQQVDCIPGKHERPQPDLCGESAHFGRRVVFLGSPDLQTTRPPPAPRRNLKSDRREPTLFVLAECRHMPIPHPADQQSNFIITIAIDIDVNLRPPLRKSSDNW